MDQGSNFKKEVMEALFNAPTNLITNKAIIWALSNLPDEGGNGTHNTRFGSDRNGYDHSNDSFWKAIGMGEETPDKISDSVRDAIVGVCRNTDGSRIAKSAIFEHIEKTCGAEGMMFLATKGFFECMTELEKAVESAGDLGSILKQLDDLRKRLGGAE